MGKETVKKKFLRYRDDKGNPTCCFKVPKDVCPFMRATLFGNAEICALQIGNTQLRRRDNHGTVIPNHECCIIWTKEELQAASGELLLSAKGE